MLPAEARAHAGPLALVLLDNGDRAADLRGRHAELLRLTRYNWSSYYALAVMALGEAVARAR